MKGLLGLLLSLTLGGGEKPSPSPAMGSATKSRDACQLTVHNKTSFRALVYVDGVYWGWVSPERSFTFSGIPKGERLIYADTQYKEFFWGPQPVKCDGTASWDLRF